MSLKIGEVQELYIGRLVSFGAYLREKDGEEEVLLPKSQLPVKAEVGAAVQVFVYRDSEDRLIATVNRPLLTLHECARLVVKDEGKVGVFLDMGLERDLLLPYKEQTYKVHVGEEVLCAMYVDKSGRLAATMKVYPYLKKDAPYAKDDEVDGIVYEISDNFGAFVAVDYCYSALVPRRELTEDVKCGDRLKFRVAGVKEDGKLDLSLRQKAFLQMGVDGDIIMNLLKKNGGSLKIGDKSDPEDIKRICHMSKAAFKRASGHLMKKGLVKISESDIILTEKKSDSEDVPPSHRFQEEKKPKPLLKHKSFVRENSNSGRGKGGKGHPSKRRES